MRASSAVSTRPKWAAGQRSDGTPSSDQEASAGRAVFLSKPCAACHAIRGANSSAGTGPDLTHVGGRTTIAAGLVDRLQGQLVRHQFRLSLRPGRPGVSLQELTEVVGAIAGRDPDRAEAATAAHFRSVLAALTESSQDTGGPA